MTKPSDQTSAAQDFLTEMTTGNYGVILADPPGRFTNRTGKVAPEHKRLNRYGTLSLKEIKEIPVAKVAADQSHLYLWVPNALTTEVVLFGVRGKLRTLQPGRSQVNIMKSRKQEHARKPNELYRIIEECSPGPYLELFARGGRPGWSVWGNQAENYIPDWPTYKNHSQIVEQIIKPRKKSSSRL